MTLILDAGGVSALAGRRGRLAGFVRRNENPPQVPAIVLAEALTGDHRRDHEANRLLRFCEVCDVDETLAREAARLRTLTERAGEIRAADAVVAAFASRQRNPIVMTSDPKDLIALGEHVRQPFAIDVV
jgi:predicted nucleic acid-binding protein